ncbi:molybdopterin molybdenumtransferase MoeA, partial [Acidovorax cattleyae]|nr:molybdopterin molybdenumtransferase MoeA [Paracidovorax cattleyae]
MNAAATPSRPPLKPLEDALAELLAQASPLEGSDEVDTFEADGRVLAADAVSPLRVPPHDNSAMDGYAVRRADVAAAGASLAIELPVSQRIAAGSAPQPLQPGTAARIFTGAPLPPGADAVCMQEDCEALDGGARVRIQAVPQPGQWVRRAGEDIEAGATVLP